MSEIVERKVMKTLIVPWTKKEKEKWVDEMIENQKAADEKADEIAPINVQRKSFQQISDDAKDKLTTGNKQQVECMETLDYDKKRVKTIRLDTGKKAEPDRDLNEEDEQMATGDSEIQEDIPGV